MSLKQLGGGRNFVYILATRINWLVGASWECRGPARKSPWPREMLATKDRVLVNGQCSELVEGGPYTREDPATGKLSCLDLSIVSRELWPYVQKLVIDRDKKFTPARPVKKKGKYRLIYTDHFSTLLTTNNMPRRQKEKERKGFCGI